MNPPNVPGTTTLPENGPGALPPVPNLPQTPAKQSRGGLFSGRNIVIGCGALVLLCICGFVVLFAVTGGAIATVFTQVAAPAAVGVEFMTAIQSDDFAKAYALCSPDLQRKLGSPNALPTLIAGANARPASYTFSNTKFQNGQWELGGPATFAGGRTGTASLIIVKVGSDWKVDAFNFTPQ